MNQNNTLDIRIKVFTKAYIDCRFNTNEELYHYGTTFLFLDMKQMDDAILNLLLKLRSC